MLFALLFIPKFIISNYSFTLNHIVLPVAIDKKYDYVENYFDQEMSVILKSELKTIQDKEILLNGIKQPGTRNTTLYKNFAFQSENLWTDLDEGKKILIKKSLNFWELGPSSLNDRVLNFGDTKKPKYGTNLVFPVLFKLDFKEISKNSNLCFKGNLIYQAIDGYRIIKNKRSKCLSINDTFTYYFIDYDRTLEIEINKSFLHDHYKNIFFIITLIQLLILFSFCTSFKSINFFYISLNLCFYLVLFLYFKFGLQTVSGFAETIYFDRGRDGMAHFGYARLILNYFFTENYYEAFKGVEGTFYYMPLLRYINALLMIFFGETVLGSIFIISLFGILIYLILSILIGDLASRILTFIFLFIPIFEALGFTLINYISFTVDGYGEGIGYFFLLLLTYLFLLDENKKFKFFLIGFLSFIVVGLRPNYLVFTYSLIFFYTVYLIITNYRYKKINNLTLKIFLMLLGVSFIFLFAFHNYFYSNEIIFLVQRSNIEETQKINISDYYILFKSIFVEEFKFKILANIMHHSKFYIKYYEIWFMIIFLNLLITLFIKIDIKIKILSLSSILMHLTFLLFLGTPRYSLGAWVISFLIFIYVANHFYLPYLKLKFFQQSNKLT
ncbi:hypothetical protein OAB35_00390 [bacterium]|jgi:hypothetical protein|nr:hypothetical protein [bacterium]